MTDACEWHRENGLFVNGMVALPTRFTSFLDTSRICHARQQWVRLQNSNELMRLARDLTKCEQKSELKIVASPCARLAVLREYRV